MVVTDGAAELNRSVIGRLLQELSWVGRSIRDYRQGGVGYENVLVAETMLALDFLPRAEFLGAVLGAANGAAGARAALIDEIETAELLTLPPEIKLRPSAPSYQEQLIVQPDGSLISPSVYALVEAKRIRQGRFQEEQLAREFVAVTREAVGRIPLLLLIIPTPPPVPVAHLGRLSVTDAIAARLDAVLGRTEASELTADDLRCRINDTVAWITWPQLADAVARARRDLHIDQPSIAASVTRLCDFIADAIDRHG
jgi:hypothetical protein